MDAPNWETAPRNVVPWGEGAASTASLLICDVRLFENRAAIPPLPQGEGRGEGEGTARQHNVQIVPRTPAEFGFRILGFPRISAFRFRHSQSTDHLRRRIRGVHGVFRCRGSRRHQLLHSRRHLFRGELALRFDDQGPNALQHLACAPQPA